MQLFHDVCAQCSKLTTDRYSTSFSTAIRLLHPQLRQPIHNIYGFVRFADEIVDSFHGYDQANLLHSFEQQTVEAIDARISTHPIIQSFQLTVHQYDIDLALVNAFFTSMKMDLHSISYDRDRYDNYIYGSAESVGLMCLHVFCEGDHKLYASLKASAQSLGAAFQKINFLRDIKDDHALLARTYFPGCDISRFDAVDKQQIEAEIKIDFEKAYAGILQLPVKARFGVYVAYKYYLSLFRRIRKLHHSKIMLERIRVPNVNKALIVLRAGVKNQLGMIG